MNLPRQLFKINLAVFVGIGHFSHAQEEAPGMVKMCLFYPNESGHARSDPILKQDGPSDHVHTFYGPLNFHPDTSYEQLRDTKPKLSSSPFKENQSLYWHPSIYRKTQKKGESIYTRVNNLETSPYYRWNTDTIPETVAFPPGFRMIAYSNDENADSGGETGGNLLVECCDFKKDGREDCSTTGGNPLIFPTKTCDSLNLAFAMPTCWDESKGVGTDDPFGHVAYTVDGAVGGDCPTGYTKRIPQVQLFVRIKNYKGGTYQLADGTDIFHVDFMNGWQENKLTNIIQDCEPSGEPGYNPPCDCDQFLTDTPMPAETVCDDEVRQYIIDEATDVVNVLPRASNSNVGVITKTWTDDEDPPFDCSPAVFIKTLKEKLKKKGSTYIPILDITLRDEDDKKVAGINVAIDYNYTTDVVGTISKKTKKSGKVSIKLPKIPRGEPVDVKIASILKNGYRYDDTKNQKINGCPAFSSECSVITLLME